MLLTTLWPSGIQVDEAAEVEVFSRELLDRITADPSVETSIAGDKLTIRATNGTWVYKLDRAGATVTEITGHLVSHRDTGSIDIYELEEETETPRFGDGFNLVLENVRAEARQTRNLIRRIMSDLQSHLNTDVSALADVINQLDGEITTLKGQEGPVDFSQADALVASAQASLAKLTAPPALGAAIPDVAAPAQPSATDVTPADAADGSSADPAPVEVQALTGPVGDLPTATAGGGYSTTLVASGGTPPYTFLVEGLPPGLTATAEGVISGTPEVRGSSTLVVTVTDITGASVESAPVLTAS